MAYNSKIKIEVLLAACKVATIEFGVRGKKLRATSKTRPNAVSQWYDNEDYGLEAALAEVKEKEAVYVVKS